MQDWLSWEKSALGHKRKWQHVSDTSALLRKADITEPERLQMMLPGRAAFMGTADKEVAGTERTLAGPN
jgi:hypothetical protein